MNNPPSVEASTPASGSPTRPDNMLERVFGRRDASPTRGTAPELSPEDRSALEELDELRKFGEMLDAQGAGDSLKDLEPLIHELIDKLGVRRGEPGAEERRTLIETQGNVPVETLEMIDHFAQTRAELEAQRRQAGLKDKEVTGQFASDMKGLSRAWPQLTMPERADEIGRLINARLQGIGVPELKVTTQPLNDNDEGKFRYVDWSIVINERTLAAPQLSASQFADLTNTVYHEARHAEQWYLIARVMAEDGVAPDETSDETKIPLAVCETAAQEPPLSDAQADAATSFYDSVYGKHAAYRNNVLANLDRFGRFLPQADRAYAESAADPNASPEERRQKAQAYARLRELARDNHRAYRALPEEADAWEVGDAAGEAYRIAPAAGASRD